MPKIIEGIREQLLEEVRRELEEYGYAKTTVRSVASRCNLGVGTVYNYFPSKDMLVASVIAEDWARAKERFLASPHEGKRERVKDVYGMLSLFIKEHESIFSDPEAEKNTLLSSQSATASCYGKSLLSSYLYVQARRIHSSSLLSYRKHFSHGL